MVYSASPPYLATSPDTPALSPSPATMVTIAAPNATRRVRI